MALVRMPRRNPPVARTSELAPSRVDECLRTKRRFYSLSSMATTFFLVAIHHPSNHAVAVVARLVITSLSAVPSGVAPPSRTTHVVRERQRPGTEREPHAIHCEGRAN